MSQHDEEEIVEFTEQIMQVADYWERLSALMIGYLFLYDKRPPVRIELR